MGAGKNKNHRKKRISKHVLESQERKRQTDVENNLIAAADRKGPDSPTATAVATNAAATQGAADKRKEIRAASLKTKDPQQAASYLSQWNYDRENNTKRWKFNKNTQSWLIRHMYDFDKVSKKTLGLLAEYICEGGEGLRSRAEEEAKRRARRYKDWEKKQQQQEEELQEGTNEANIKSTQKGAQESDNLSWNELDDHDKRKEYKRARKLLDALKTAKVKNEKDL